FWMRTTARFVRAHGKRRQPTLLVLAHEAGEGIGNSTGNFRHRRVSLVPEPDPELSRLLGEHVVPGAVLGHLRNGEIESVAAGVADTSTGEVMTPDTRFAVGSLAKSMVATAVARLAAAGALSLDDAAATHVPELGGVAWAERATIRDLLANRSGLPLRDALEFPESSPDDDRVLARIAAEIARAEPTDVRWSYTNSGWCLLGRALETVTGLVWE